MPLYSEHISNMYYGGSPSYSAPYSYSSSVLPSYTSASYLNSGGSYSNHSSLGGYSRPISSRWVPSSARNYSPILSTISERGTSSPSRLLSPRRIQLSKRSYAASSYTPRPIHINTADIDVSRDRYRQQKAPSPPPTPARTKTPSPEKDNGPYMPRVDEKPDTGIDSSPGTQRSTIKRGRTVVRLHTVKRKEKDSPRKSQTDDSQPQQQEVSDVYENCVENVVEDVMKNETAEPVRWREKLSEDLTYKDKREKKTLGARLVEKFIVRDKDSDSDGSFKEKSRKLDVISRPQETPLSISTSPRILSPDRRCSIEMLAEQACLLDSLIRGENLSTATLDLSKVGVDEDCKSAIEPSQQIKRRKSNNRENALKTTKSDQSLHETLKSIKDSKHFSKKRSLKKSSSAGGNICRLDSIKEFPKDPTFANLPPIEESRLSIKRESIKSKPKPKLRAKITSSVEVSEPKSPLKFKIENVTVEETPRIPKNEIIYSTVVDEVLPNLQTSESTPKEESATKAPRKQMQYDTKKRTKTLVREENVPEFPEPDEGNFWDKIGKRETVYLLKRKQYIENNREQNRRAMYWFPEDEESGPNDGANTKNTEDLLSTSSMESENNILDMSQMMQSSDSIIESIALETKDEQLSPLALQSGQGKEKEKIPQVQTVLDTNEIISPAIKEEYIAPGTAQGSYEQKNKSTFEGIEKVFPVQKDTVDIKTKHPTPDKTLKIEQTFIGTLKSLESIDEQKGLKKKNSLETKKESPMPDKFLEPKQKLDERLKSVESTDEQKELKKKNSLETKKKSPKLDKTLAPEQKMYEKLKPGEIIDEQTEIKKKNSLETKKKSPKSDKTLAPEQKMDEKLKPGESIDEQTETKKKNSLEIKKKSPTPYKTFVPEQKSDEKLKSVESIDEQKEKEKKFSLGIEKKFPTPDKTLVEEQKINEKLKSVESIDEEKELIKEESIDNKNKSPLSSKTLDSEQKFGRLESKESSEKPKECEKCRKGSGKDKTSVKLPDNMSSTEEKIISQQYEEKENPNERKTSVSVPEQNCKESNTTKIKSPDKSQQKIGDKLKAFENDNIGKECENKKNLNTSGKETAIAPKDEGTKVAKVVNNKIVQDITKQNIVKTSNVLAEKAQKQEKKCEEIKIPQSTILEQRVEVIKINEIDKISNKNTDTKLSKDSIATVSPQSELAKVVQPPPVTSSSKDDTQTSLQKTPDASLSIVQSVTNKDDSSSYVPTTVVESENIPNKGIQVEIETLKQEEQTTGEDKKAENITQQGEKQEDVKKLSVKGIIKQPAPCKPLKEAAAVRPLIATPRPLQKKAPQIIHSSSSSESSSEDDSSEDDDADESDTSEGSTEFFECENNADGRTSTGSNDSGFDSSAPNSPAGFLQMKKDCDVNCHRKCEKLTANLCGVNQRLLVEALASRTSSKRGGESAGTPGTSGTASAHADSSDISEQELEQSTAYGIFRKTGRFTPPARTIPRFRKYNIEDFHFIKVLGKGSFGKVMLAELRDTEYYYAVKCLKKDVVLEDDDVECTLIERKVLALGTNHPYLCHLFATFQTDSHLFFVMEYLNGGDLMFHIQQSGRFPEARARFYAAEIVSGLKFLHKRGIVYRDLKLDNILLDFEGHVRIADFGMCKLQIYLDKTADTFCGTPDYMAPEIIKGQKYNQTVDWWSFGVLLYEMLIGQSPFSGCDEDELFWSICNEMPSYPRFLSQEALVILTRLMDKDARTRLGGTECMHGDVRDQDFFHPVHWDKLERKELETPFKPRVRHPLDTQYFDRAFTGERPRLTAVEPSVLRSMDQEPFRGFSYTNPNATDR